MLIDTHCHLNFDAYDSDRAAVLERAAASGVTRILIPAVDIPSGQQAAQLAGEHPGVIFAAAGIHPNATAMFNQDHIDQLRVQAALGALAIGEIGLDYHWDDSPRESQHSAFRAQLALAAELELPVIIHNREASDDVLTILAEWVADLPNSLKDRPGVLHSFSAPLASAEQALALGFYFGFSGPVTFKNAHDLRRIAALIPLDKIIVETDAPYLTPTPHRGERNEPGYVRFVAERLAALHNIDDLTFFAHTTRNAERLFPGLVR